MKDMTAFSKKYYRSLEPLINPASLGRPVDWAKLFGRSAPLELEIGSGNGEFMNRRCLDRLECSFVCVEVSWASAKSAFSRLDNPPRSNVRLVILKG